ncbi:NAD(P)H-dependent oxidoreductase [Fusobacterium nucleatum]|nr:NAD(P)H-dependent oxidoreductase [Fusobacterium nucleatum]WCB31975.1 NAD(P)H-dependent oxidoreductase [Fusobacterium nucleatum]
MKKVLVISGHPDLERSTANKAIIENLTKKMPEVAVHRLDKAIKDGYFDIQKEQELLLQYNTYIFMYPFYFFSSATLIKTWINDIFKASFSYLDGNKLKGKNVVFSITIGEPVKKSSQDRFLKHILEELTLSISYTGMNTLGYAVSYDMYFHQKIDDKEKIEEVLKKAEIHADKIIELVK